MPIILFVNGFSNLAKEPHPKHLSKESGKSKIDSELIETVWKIAKRIDNESKKLESIVNDVLTFTSFKKPVMETYSINKFIEEESLGIVTNAPHPILKLSKRLNGVHTTFVCFR